MRFLKITDTGTFEQWINTDLVTEVNITAMPEDTAYWEVTIQFGEHYMDKRFRNREDAERLVYQVMGQA